MARRRFFVEQISGGRATLSGEAADHLRRVLRARVGQCYEVCDNRAVYLAEIIQVRRGTVLFRLLEQLPAERPPLHLTLEAALVKFEHFEWMIEKATELGVRRIVPVVAARSEKGLEEGALKRMERWQRIARQASQQARRSHLPEISAPLRFQQALSEPGYRRYLLDESRQGKPLLAALPPAAVRHWTDRVAVLVGPEGGWTDCERRAAAAAGWEPVTVGSLVLRAETAAVAAVAVLINAWLAAG